jgi:phage gp29-like protein
MPAPILPIVKDINQLPPGGIGMVIPHEQTYSAVYNVATKNYSWQFDEALFDNVNNAIAMRFDPVIMEPLETRMVATALLGWHLEPEDPADQNLAQAAAGLEKRIRRMPFLQDFFMALLDALWFGRAGAQVFYEWWRDSTDGRMGLVPTGHVPINGDKLVFRYSNGPVGQVGVRVSGTFYSKQVEVTDLGRVHYFDAQERQRLVVHRHRPEDADYLRPRKAGLVHGVGLRERLYWFWALKNQIMGLLFDYLRWFAQGLTIYFYEAGNDAAYREVKSRAEENAGKPFLLFPRERTGEPNWQPVDRFDPSSASTQLMTDLITSYLDGVIRRMILGTGATTVGGSAGLNSGRSQEVQERTADSRVKYDANGLSATLSTDFVGVMNAWTYSGLPAPRWVYEIDAPNVGDVIQAADFFTSRGGRVGETTMAKMLGLPAPKPGEPVLGEALANAPGDQGGGAAAGGDDAQGGPGVSGGGGRGPARS